jgi:broad specificity phosphatase PhoE
MRTTELYIFRHGETDWNREMRFQGQTDIPLNDEGLRQAKELADLIKDCALEAIVTSDLKRAMVTAEIVNAELGLPMTVSPALRECVLGDPEGHPRKHVLEKFGEEAWRRWASIKPEDADFCYPNGETGTNHLARVKNYLEEYCRANSGLTRIGVSTHGGSVRRLLHHCDGAPAYPIEIPNCVLYKALFEHQTSKWIFLGRIE